MQDETYQIDVNVVYQLIEERANKIKKYLFENSQEKNKKQEIEWIMQYSARLELLKLKYYISMSLEENKKPMEQIKKIITEEK